MTEERSVSKTSGVAVVGGPARRPAETEVPEEVAVGESSTISRPQPPRRRRVRPRTVRPGGSAPSWLVPVLAVVSVISVLCAIVFGVKWSDLSAQNDTRATVQRVSKDFLTALTNFTPRTVDADFRTISTYAAGDFAKQSNQFFGSSIRQRLEQAQAWSKGQQRYLYVQSIDGSQAQVYAEVDQTYANNKVTAPV